MRNKLPIIQRMYFCCVCVILIAICAIILHVDYNLLKLCKSIHENSSNIHKDTKLKQMSTGRNRFILA